ncbi:MAG: endolytic transglycosylase MltG [Oscillospiraceae bacterium]|jgi:UPF0755 protein|nr:endolytic transglycosylase MltG [Oscillospiraceae bacterium]
MDKNNNYNSQDKSGGQRPANSRSSTRSSEFSTENADSFDVRYDFDGHYRSQIDPDAPVKRFRRRGTGVFSGIIAALFALLAGGVLACFLWLAATDVLAFGRTNRTEEITISKGFTLEQVADNLYDHDLIKYKKLFLWYAGFSKAQEKIVPGTYELNAIFDYRAIVSGMSARGGKRVEVEVVIPEGFTLLKIFTRLEENGVCSASELWDAAANIEFDYAFLDGIPAAGNKLRLEGFLFPDKYKFYKNDNPERVIKKFLSNFSVRFDESYQNLLTASGLTLREAIIVASMVESEAGVDVDRPLIASVIFNRLNSKDLKRLQIDATIFYAIADSDQEFSTQLDNPYNTYQNEGLPPGPISNPGLKSIKAALAPAQTKFFYYALSIEGRHEFFKTYDEHQKFVNSDMFQKIG